MVVVVVVVVMVVSVAIRVALSSLHALTEQVSDGAGRRDAVAVHLSAEGGVQLVRLQA